MLDVPVPLSLPSDGVHFMRWLQAVPSTFWTNHTIFLSLMVGVNLLIYRQHQAVNFLLPETGCSRVTVMRLLPTLIVVSALLGGCNTTGSLPPDRPNQGLTKQQTQPLHYYE